LVLPIKVEDGSLLFIAGKIARPPLPPPPPSRGLGVDLSRLLLVLLISAGVCYALARYLTMPIVRLREAAQRFAKGEFSVRVGQGVIGRKDELGRLGEDFDRMAQRIEGLVVQQRQLLGDISHELRSPLARLSLALELARRKSVPEAEAYLHRIETEAATLEEMIAHVLTLTRLESGIDGIEVEEVDLQGLVAAVVSDADFEAHGRGGMVRIAETADCVVRGNGELLRRAVENVVRNAIRYTKEGTPVEVGLRRVKDRLSGSAEIQVRDYGPGVPEADLPSLFRPFYRVSNARDRQSGGTGLGLAITDRAVRLHEGTVVAANAQGGGLVVTIRLPLHGPAV
jgi:two-component system sensor histidine kinase CpxA